METLSRVIFVHVDVGSVATPKCSGVVLALDGGVVDQTYHGGARLNI
jgi:hypothetical protein